MGAGQNKLGARCDAEGDNSMGIMSRPEGSQAEAAKTSRSSNRRRKSQSSQTAGSGISTTEHSQLVHAKYLELCVNTGQYSTRLAEIDVSNIKCDGELFIRIRERYSELRRFRLRRIFLTPVDIHFVRVSHYSPAT